MTGGGADRPVRVLAVTGGHRIDAEAFLGMLDAVCDEHDWTFAHAVQPGAQRWLRAEHAGTYDAVLCYDLPGLALKRGTEPTPVGPSPAVAHDLAALLDAGQGIVFLHHALAGWPGWPGWAEVLGGRYLYAPGRVRGADWPDSGYRFAEHRVRVLAPEHPVCRGVADFDLSDELYCAPVFADDVVPLLRTDADMSSALFTDTYHEVRGIPRDGAPWPHPAGSDLVGWAKTAGRSPIVYLQPGDGGPTFELPAYRRLIANALGWVASAPAHAGAAAHPTQVDLRLEPAPVP